MPIVILYYNTLCVIKTDIIEPASFLQESQRACVDTLQLQMTVWQWLTFNFEKEKKNKKNTSLDMYSFPFCLCFLKHRHALCERLIH